jgi:hypothetical protein
MYFIPRWFRLLSLGLSCFFYAVGAVCKEAEPSPSAIASASPEVATKSDESPQRSSTPSGLNVPNNKIPEPKKAEKDSEPNIHNRSTPMWSLGEVFLSIAALIFGVIFLAFISWALCKLVKNPSAEDILETYTIAFVIIGVLFMVAAGWGSNQIAPAIGLFGTIVGYMLGRSARPGHPNGNGGTTSGATADRPEAPKSEE